MANTPNIRFKGFTDTWQQRKLNEITTKIGSGKTPLDGKSAYVDSGIALIRSQNINDNKVDLSDVVFIDDKINSSMENSQVYRNDVLLNITGASIGRSAVYKDFKPVNVNQHVCIIRPIEGYSSEFIQLNLVSDNGQRQIESSQAGGGREGLNFQQIGKMNFQFPTIIEQVKIGAYFSTLDHLITLHQRKCDETKELKKYMLQKMFPKNGEKIPEIRFAGFTDAWEQRKFSEFVKNVAKGNKDNLDLEPYAVTNDRGFIAQKDAHDEFGYMKDTDRKAYNIVPPNSFAYNPARINVGSLGYYTGTENVIVSSLYEVFQTEEYIDDRFLWHWLKSDHFPKWIEKLQEGSVRLYFYFDKLVQCQMMIPSCEEQKKIGKYFSHLDHLITLHQRKCDNLKEVKKFMLQNMFPQKG